MASNVQQFGPFRFDGETSVLLRQGQPLPLGRRGVAILKALLTEPGRVIGKDKLLDAAWPGQAVEESNLSVQVAKLRRLIGPQWIRTIERVGYQWVPAIAPGPSVWPASRPSRTRMPLVAVTPFTAPDGSSGSDGAGITEDVVAALVQFRTIEVADADRDGRSANGLATYLLQGSIRSLGDTVRLNIRLTDTATGSHLWARVFDTNGAQTALDDVTGTIAAAVEAQVHLAEIARNASGATLQSEAYHYYLKGRAKIRSSEVTDNAAGFAFYSQALALEPDNVVFIAAAAEALHHRKAVGWPELPGADGCYARDLARSALEITDLDGDALGLIGDAMMTFGEFDWGRALCRRATEINPNSPLALTCAGLAEFWADNLESADALLARAIPLATASPTVRFACSARSRVALLREDPELALDLAHRALSVSPALSAANWSIIAAHDALGQRQKAELAYEHYRRVAPEVTIRSITAGQPFARPERLHPVLQAARRAGMPDR